MWKESYDRELEMCVLEGRTYEEPLLRMVRAGDQPDGDTVLLLLEAYRRADNVEGACALYERQVLGEGRRRAYRCVGLVVLRKRVYVYIILTRKGNCYLLIAIC